jgi:hypothetical protein
MEINKKRDTMLARVNLIKAESNVINVMGVSSINNYSTHKTNMQIEKKNCKDLLFGVKEMQNKKRNTR